MLGDRDQRTVSPAGSASPLGLALRTSVSVTLREIAAHGVPSGDGAGTDVGDVLLRDLAADQLPNQPHEATQSSN